MEQNNDNKKIEELTDEQLKEVTGGILTYDDDDDDEDRCPNIGYCVKYDALCNCTKCDVGRALVSGVCKPPYPIRG